MTVLYRNNPGVVISNRKLDGGHECGWCELLDHPTEAGHILVPLTA